MIWFTVLERGLDYVVGELESLYYAAVSLPYEYRKQYVNLSAFEDAETKVEIVSSVTGKA
jgi:hypothetical protein